MDQQRLSSLRPGESCRVLLVEGKDRQIRRRLFDMGVTPGAEIFVRKTAPLGDPVEITIRNYELTLRKNEAEAVLVEVTSHGSEK